MATASSPSVAVTAAAILEAPAVPGVPDAEAEAASYKFEADSAWAAKAYEVIGAIQTKYKSEFVRERYEGASVTVSFAGQAPEGALELLKNIGIPYRVEQNLGFTAAELDVLAMDAHIAIRDSVPEGSGINSGWTLENRTIDVQVSPPIVKAGQKTTPLDVKALNNELTAKVLPSTPAGFATVVTETTGGPVVPASSWGQAGGNQLNVQNGGAFACTSAFVVIKNGEIGVLTAAHCPNDLRQMSSNGNFNFDFRAEHIGVLGDFQWMRSPVMMDAWFHQNFNVGQAQTGTGAAGVNGPICKFGVAGGRDCSIVSAVGRNVQYTTGQTVSNQTEVNGTFVVPGDSGGPIFLSGVALGVVDSQGATHNYFTPINTVIANTNVTLCIDPDC
jgi:hypothetical protein